ncbi:hypothetical protein QNH39_05185 [Neobacillus novalis]|uniref:Uncharacterized protein n=1 Tax=Neobacillus novalis TaxID=220687 RepID=A0AA95SC35_9BACI|nr:hypothetical protein [Neobacillus novalis]WHY87254.1 hypothetical protein QNH39_05185 [Neobacillus novalis]
MKYKPLFVFVLFFTAITSFFMPSKSSASWVNLFVVWDGYTYVVSDENVTEIDKEIGHVTKYSDMEGTYSGNFSNIYKKGTKYYSIKGISTDDAIAIKEKDGIYKKATREGEYAGNKNDFLKPGSFTIIIGILFLLLVIAIGFYFVEKKGKKGK